MNLNSNKHEIDKCYTGIPGFDLIARGGLPRERTTLLSGSSGSGKTVFGCQFLAEGILKSGENGVYVTFEEDADDIRSNMHGFDWSIEDWEDEKKWAFVDASSHFREDSVQVGKFDLSGLIVRILNAIKKVDAKRVSIDSLGSLFSQFTDHTVVRREILRLGLRLKQENVTILITAERASEDGNIARFGVEEFATANVVVLRNRLEEERRRRTIEILKFRGASHQKGEYSFTLNPGEGMTIIPPLFTLKLAQESTQKRITSGVKALDDMCGGGFFQDSILLVSGATGTGKTLMSTHFIGAGVNSDEKCLLFAFEESRRQLIRNAAGWGVDFETMEKSGKLKIVADYPEVATLEEHLIHIKDSIEKYEPNRFALDSISALERVATKQGFREFAIRLSSYLKQKGIASMMTSTTNSLWGARSVTQEHISTMTDTIILLRYLEIDGQMLRGINVLKMRGSQHNNHIMRYSIDENGMSIGESFKGVGGFMSGGAGMFLSDESVSRTRD